MVKLLVQMFPPSVECQSGALVPQLPENAVITISLGFSWLMAILVSPSLNVSVNLKVESVLFTTTSTTAGAGNRPGFKLSGI
jgi:hypothetical protein